VSTGAIPPRGGRPAAMKAGMLAMVLVLLLATGCGDWRERIIEEGAKTAVDKVKEWLGLKTGNDPSKGEVPEDIAALIMKYGSEAPCALMSVPLLAAQLYQESKFNPKAKSDAKAMGIAQFIPSTWADEKMDGDGDGDMDVWDPKDAIPASVAYSCKVAGWVKDAAGDPVANMLAAYNGGANQVIKHNGDKSKFYKESRDYIDLIYKYRDLFAANIVEGDAANSGKASTVGQEIVNLADGVTRKKVPYVWGGGNQSGPTGGGYDCSGLVLWAVYQAKLKHQVTPNKALPHYTGDQVKKGKHVDAGQMLPGDAIYLWENYVVLDPYHVVIYAGKKNGVDMLIEAPRTGLNIRWAPLSSYKKVTHREARRFG
jgi:hypothetical protein